MSLNLLYRISDSCIVRRSAVSFSIASDGKVTNNETHEVLDDDLYSQVSTTKTLPSDFRPWAYKWVSGDFAASGMSLPPIANTTVVFKPLTPSQFIRTVAGAVGFARCDELLAKSNSVRLLIADATSIDRMSASTLAAIGYLKTGATPLTDSELALVDAVWAAFV